MDVDLFPIPTTLYYESIYTLPRGGGRGMARDVERAITRARTFPSRVRVGWRGKEKSGTNKSSPVGRSSSSWSPFSGSTGFLQDPGEYMQKGETEWKNYPSGLFSLGTRDKRFPLYCYFCVIPPRVSAVSTFNQLSSCYLRTERRFTSRTFLFKLRYRGLQGITGREEGIVYFFSFSFSFSFFSLFCAT